jgi:hypothetical protein
MPRSKRPRRGAYRFRRGKSAAREYRPGAGCFRVRANRFVSARLARGAGEDEVDAFRDKDRMHLRDLIDVGLVNSGWCARLPAALAARLQQLLDNPEG